MNNKPKLILLSGFAGVGKTTLAKRYIAEHPLAMSIEEDELIGMIGQWAEHETESRAYVLNFIKSIVKLHLHNKKTVLIPHLLTDVKYSEDLEMIAKECNAEYFEVYLSVEKSNAIALLFERGTWGEAGAPPITKKDLPIIEEKYALMLRETEKRLGMVAINPIKNDIESTYKALLKIVREQIDEDLVK